MRRRFGPWMWAALCTAASLSATAAPPAPDLPDPAAPPALAPPLSAAPAAAPPPAGAEALPAPDFRFRGLVEGSLSAGQIGEDAFLTVLLGVALEDETLSLALAAPLRFRVQDREPKRPGALRPEDWDEVSDFLRIVQRLRYTAPNGVLSVQLGQAQGASLGNGTLVDRYYSAVEVDHYQASFAAAVEIAGLRTDLLLDNVVDPSLVALRWGVLPLVMARSRPRLQGLEVGLTALVDGAAPAYYRCEPTGRPRVTSDREIDATNAPFLAYGLDFGWAFAAAPNWDVRPYSDVNGLADFAVGWHLGLVVRWQFAEKSALALRGEYRLGSPRYSAAYVNPLYELERMAFPRTRRGAAACEDGPSGPKQQALRDVQGPLVHGALFEAQLLLFNRLHVELAFEEGNASHDAALRVGAALPNLYGVGLHALWVKRAAADAAELFSLDRSLIVLHGRYTFFDVGFVFAEWAHEWRVSSDGAAAGGYEGIDDWRAGAGVDLRF